MRIFVTGATGFIGRAFCRVALARGHQVLGLSRQPATALPPGVELAQGTLIHTPWEQVGKFAPEVALHLAWITTPGIYLSSAENETWLEQSKAWLTQARALGIPHVAGVGTCIEHAASPQPLREDSPLESATPYAKAKTALFEWLRQGGLGADGCWSWFRVFYAYGPGENRGRLCSTLISRLRAGQSLDLRTPGSVKDYIYVDDVALGLCQALEARLTGAINVGTGNGIDVESLATSLTRLLGMDASLVRRADVPDADTHPVVIADPTRLKSLGWKPRISLEEGLRRLIDSLSAGTDSGDRDSADACPGCGAAELGDRLSLPRQPVILNYRFDSAEAARNVARRDMLLRECPRCGLVFNAIHDTAALPYDEHYDNRQSFSSGFQALLEQTADTLTHRYLPHGATVLEVGCGKGDFLKLLCARARARGLGYDTSCEAEGTQADGRITWFQRHVSPADVKGKIDLVVCRHVVEHVPDIGAFFRLLHGIAVAGGNAVVYVETPAFEWIVEQEAFWDVFYEHCNYFSGPTLCRLARQAGFTVLEHRLIFDGQYQALELRPAAGPAPGADSPSTPILQSFATSLAGSRRQVVEELMAHGAARDWAIWGAGAKGVCLANSLTDFPPSFVIDSNPGKQGKFLPGTGIPVVAPGDARVAEVPVILVANGNYLEEIRAVLQQRGLAPHLLPL